MLPFKPESRGRGNGPEAEIQRAIVKMLRRRGWFVKVTEGTETSNGWPDLWATHKLYGARFIEVKNPDYWRITNAQLWDFPLMIENGTPVYVLIAATELEYNKLMRESNYHEYHDAAIRGYHNIWDYRRDQSIGGLRPVEIDVSKLRNLEAGEDENEVD